MKSKMILQFNREINQLERVISVHISDDGVHVAITDSSLNAVDQPDLAMALSEEIEERVEQSAGLHQMMNPECIARVNEKGNLEVYFCGEKFVTPPIDLSEFMFHNAHLTNNI